MRVAYTPLSLAIATILLSSIVHAEVDRVEVDHVETVDTEATVQESQKVTTTKDTTIKGATLNPSKPQVHQLQVITVQAHPLSQSENDLVQASNILEKEWNQIHL